MTRLERFMAKVQMTPTCWLWTGAVSGRGYGAFWMPPRQTYAHRAAWELLVGPIPEGLEIDHLCRVLTCVNPGHLEPVDHYENVQRSRRTECVRGHLFDERNTYIDPRGWRHCRTCDSARQRNRSTAA